MKLKHRDFALTYIADPKRCAGRAYATVYGHDYESNRGSCDANASRLLKHDKVSSFIAEKDTEDEKRITEKYQVEQDTVTHALACIAFSNISDYFEWDNNDVQLKDMDSISMEARGAIKDINIQTNAQGKKSFTLKLHNKRQALVDLGKHIGMFTQKVELGLADELMAEFFKEIDGSTRDPAMK